MTKTAAEVILSQLSAWGVNNMYGVIGDAILPFISAVGKQDKINYYAVRHETAAAFMASAEAKTTRRIAVCTGTSGPGLANMMNGIADAAADHVPMLVITGQVETKKIGTESKQYVEQQQMISPLAVYSANVTHPDSVPKLLQKALIEALSKRGVAHLSIPKDIFSAPCTAEEMLPVGILWSQVPEDFTQLDAAVDMLSTSNKPVLYLGEGARNASSSIIHLAESVQAAIIETLGAKGTVPYDHTLNIGGIGEGGTEESAQLLQESDCVLVIGANWWPQNFVPVDTKIISIDVSAASIEAHPEVVHGIVGDASRVVPLLMERIEKRDRSAWEERITTVKQSIISKLDDERQRSGSPLAPQRIMAALDETLDSHAIVAVDTGDHTVWFNRIFRSKKQHPVFSGTWRTMGFGLPAALSAKIQYPDRQVIAIVGDGGFSMSMMELSTAIKYELPITVIVLNNQSLAKEESSMLAKDMDPFAVKLTNPNFAALAKSFGIQGFRVEHADELIPALQEAFESSTVAVIEVMTSTEVPPFA